ncbi:MAG TPA: helix-turn-helix domain-containing protein, partial [Candidatus Limnocylindrales bacterium]|nr:helix-turn-helix domain-containing protein [Candidatus Limnocylindrales bacterium]
MDDIALGRLFRILRLRLGLRSQDVAERAGISLSAYSEMERGDLASVPVGKIRRVGGVLEVRVVLGATWRGAEVDRVLGSRHAGMAEAVTRLLVASGWEVRPEVSFNHFGERGVVDLIAWHAGTATLLLIELKTELADVNALLGTADRRRRLAATIAAPLEWRPANVAQWLVIADSSTNRRRVAAHRTLLRAAFPTDGRAIRGWLARPSTA